MVEHRETDFADFTASQNTSERSLLNSRVEELSSELARIKEQTARTESVKDADTEAAMTKLLAKQKELEDKLADETALVDKIIASLSGKPGIRVSTNEATRPEFKVSAVLPALDIPRETQRLVPGAPYTQEYRQQVGVSTPAADKIAGSGVTTQSGTVSSIKSTLGNIGSMLGLPRIGSNSSSETPASSKSNSGIIGGSNISDSSKQFISSSTSAYLATVRKKYFDEIDKDPELKDEVMRMARSENGKTATSMSEVIEAAVNRTDMHGYKSIKQQLHDGFYGPINRGDSEFTRPLTEPERAKGEEAISRVRSGQNNIEHRTDQGMLTDPGAKEYLQEPDKGGWIKRSGENFFYMGKKGRAWAEQQREAEKKFNSEHLQENKNNTEQSQHADLVSTADSTGNNKLEYGMGKFPNSSLSNNEITSLEKSRENNARATVSFQGFSEKSALGKESFIGGSGRNESYPSTPYGTWSLTPQEHAGSIIADVHERVGRNSSGEWKEGWNKRVADTTWNIGIPGNETGTGTRDPKVGRARSEMQVHAGHEITINSDNVAGDIKKLYTSGCLGIKAEDYPHFIETMQKAAKDAPGGKLALVVSPGKDKGASNYTIIPAEHAKNPMSVERAVQNVTETGSISRKHTNEENYSKVTSQKAQISKAPALEAQINKTPKKESASSSTVIDKENTSDKRAEILDMTAKKEDTARNTQQPSKESVMPDKRAETIGAAAASKAITEKIPSQPVDTQSPITTKQSAQAVSTQVQNSQPIRNTQSNDDSWHESYLSPSMAGMSRVESSYVRPNTGLCAEFA